MNKQSTKRSRAISTDETEPPGSPSAADDGFTQRMLLSMLFDVSQLAENVERVKVEVFTLAKAHGIVPPKSD